jgi:tetratricopeptide (TPR) repeat protein
VISLLDAGRLPRKAAAGIGLAALVASAVLITGQGRRWSDPVRLWDHARATAPASFRAQTNAGLALAAAGRWDEADAAVTAALALNPDYPPALVARGVMAYRRGDRGAAMADYRSAAALRPQYVPALYNLALLAQEGNDPAAAEQWYRRVLDINPLHADTLLNFGVLLLTQGRINEAETVLAAARSVSPESAAVQYYCGVAAERQSHTRDAQRYFREALRLAQAHRLDALAADAQMRLTALDEKPAAPRR